MDWQAVKVLFCDVDGVLTDGGLYFGPEGQLFKRFNVLDGLGLRRLASVGVKVIFISGDDTAIVPARARRLDVTEVYTCCEDKATVVRQTLERIELRAEQACFIGDDVLDVPGMREVGFPVAPPNAHPLALQAACYVTRRPGGHGAVREICDLIQGLPWPDN